jgi:RNA polymerase sigma factor (TIGR02999 family)
MTWQDSVTGWLRLWREGDNDALEHITESVYRELKRLAAHYLDREQSGHTLQPTALVHEAYLHIAAVREIDWKARGQFIAVVAQMMRRILIDHARRRGAAKREMPGNLSDPPHRPEDPMLDVLAVDQALERMAHRHPRPAQIVELRFFGGLESNEIAQCMDISLSTVEREWRFARAWLQSRISSV